MFGWYVYYMGEGEFSRAILRISSASKTSSAFWRACGNQKKGEGARALSV